MNSRSFARASGHTVLLLTSVVAFTSGLAALPFTAQSPTDVPAPFVLAGGNGAVVGRGWRNAGTPFYFENCWWQRQVRYVRGGVEYSNRKLSCPGLSYGAGAIVQPSPLPKR